MDILQLFNMFLNALEVVVISESFNKIKMPLKEDIMFDLIGSDGF